MPVDPAGVRGKQPGEAQLATEFQHEAKINLYDQFLSSRAQFLV
jgi:hypothetical protein